MDLALNDFITKENNNNMKIKNERLDNILNYLNNNNLENSNLNNNNFENNENIFNNNLDNEEINFNNNEINLEENNLNKKEEKIINNYLEKNIELNSEKTLNYKTEELNNKDINNYLEKKVDITILDNKDLEVTSENQNKFLETTFGRVINTAVDIGIKTVLPKYVEDQVIDIKDAVLNEGFFEGVKTAINKVVDAGKSAIGIFTGKFENMSQVQTAIKTGGLLDCVSTLFDTGLSSAKKNKKINSTAYSLLKKGKNTVIKSVTNKIENEFTKQLDDIEKLYKYQNNWKQYFNDKNFDGMEKEYRKIKTKLNNILPMEKTINDSRILENLHVLIKNNNQKFDLTNEQKELAKILI